MAPSSAATRVPRTPRAPRHRQDTESAAQRRKEEGKLKMATGWVTKIERCSCPCGWTATRQRPAKCPACSAAAVTVETGWRSWKANYRERSGRKRSRTFTKKADAEAFLVDTVGTVNKRTYRDPDSGREVFGDYLRARIETSPKFGASTRHLYALEAEKYIYPALGDMQVRELD